MFMAQFPVTKGRVRATVNFATWIISPAEEGGFKVIYLANGDPNGSLPAIAARAVMLDTPACSGRALRYLNKFGVPKMNE
jgi:hypothetical protein